MESKDWSFDTNEVEVKTFGPLPEGDYIVALTAIKEKETKRGGLMLEAEFTVMEGSCARKKLWHYFNVMNPPDYQAVEGVKSGAMIGKAQLTQMVTEMTGTKPASCGPSLLSELIGAAVGVHVKITKDDKWGDGNKISYFKPASKVLKEVVDPNASEDVPW